MQWTRLGRVYAPDGSRSWMTSHAYLPTPYALDGNTIRVYVSFLDRDRVGRIGWVDVEATDPLRVLRVSERPALDVGAVGAFDEHGVTPSAIVTDGETLRLYYFGSQRAIKVPHLSFAGLAVSEDGGETFERLERVPILPRLDGEGICRSTPFVGRQGEFWRAWYVAADKWTELEGQLVPVCEIRCLYSDDGIRWEGPGKTAVARAGDDEVAVVRPFVQASGDAYRMWYSIRSRTRGCRIGWATSLDGSSWTRQDDDSIDVSVNGWDSEMVCFASVLTTGDRTYFFYNGNRCGETGFGVALLEGG